MTRLRARTVPWWWLPASVAFVAVRMLQPRYIDNETGYIVGPIKILDPDFLPRHAFVERFNPFFWVFDVAAAPLYVVFDWLWATLILRIVIWIFQLWALARLGRTLGLAPWALLLMLVLWLNVEQTLVAGEWIIGCASAKPVAYGFVFLALEAALRGRHTLTAVFAGLATCFHVLVGGYVLVGLGIGLLVGAEPGTRMRVALRYGLPAAAIALVGLAPALYTIVTSRGAAQGAAEALDNARLYVEWMNPYHLDPTYFMSPGEYGKLVGYGILTLGLTAVLARREHRRLLIGFLSVLAVIFAGGMLARRAEWWVALKYYPFRVADGIYPLAFWACVVAVLQSAVDRLGRAGWALVILSLPFASLVRWTNDRLDPRREPEEGPESPITEVLHSEPRMSAYWLRETGREWLAFARGEPQDDLAPMLDWIRDSTPPDAVFLVPPWRDDFTLRARRSEFVSSKTPVVERMREYRERLEAANGGRIAGRGRAIFRELRRNYPSLTADQVRGIAARFRVQYFLTPTDYGPSLRKAHEAQGWRLYALEGG